MNIIPEVLISILDWRGLLSHSGRVAEKRSGCCPAPPELHAGTLGDEEEVVAQGADVFIVDGDDTEVAVAVGPGEGREIPGHLPLGVHAPGVSQLQASLREFEGYAPPLISRDLEVAWQPTCGDHSVLQVLREGPLVGLDPGEIIRVVHRPGGSRRVEAILRNLHSLGRVEPYERDRRTPEVLYHPERHVAALRRLSDRLGEAHCRQAHVPWLPRMWLSHGP